MRKARSNAPKAGHRIASAAAGQDNCSLGWLQAEQLPRLSANEPGLPDLHRSLQPRPAPGLLLHVQLSRQLGRFLFCSISSHSPVLQRVSPPDRLNMRKNFFPLRVTEPWPRLPREAVESPSLEIFKTRLDKVLCSLLWVTLLQQEGWTRWPTEVPSNPYYSVILYAEVYLQIHMTTYSRVF